MNLRGCVWMTRGSTIDGHPMTAPKRSKCAGGRISTNNNVAGDEAAINEVASDEHEPRDDERR